jgi:hypothetical protein
MSQARSRRSGGRRLYSVSVAAASAAAVLDATGSAAGLAPDRFVRLPGRSARQISSGAKRSSRTRTFRLVLPLKSPPVPSGRPAASGCQLLKHRRLTSRRVSKHLAQ